MIDPKHILAVRDRIIRDRGWLVLLALAEREDFAGRWDLLVVGGGLTAASLDNYKYVADVLDHELTRDEILSLNYFALIREENEWVQRLVDRVHVEGDEPVEIENVELGTIPVRRALIFHAERAEVGAARA